MTTPWEQRLPPQSLEAEMAVLGSMLIDGQDQKIYPDILLVLRADDFYRAAYRMVYTALVHLYERHGAIDIVLLRDELKRRNQLEAVGGVDALVALVESVPSAANGLYYARIVRDKALLRQVIQACGEIMRRAYEDVADVGEFLDEVGGRILPLTEQRATAAAKPLAEIIPPLVERITHPDSHCPGGIPTGFEELDYLTTGLHKGEMIVIAARPSMGKTALGLNIAAHAAREGRAVLFFSLEMNAEQLGLRLLTTESRVDTYNIRRGFLTSRDHEQLAAGGDQLNLRPLYIADTPILTPLELRARARQARHAWGAELVIIDYLQLIKAPDRRNKCEQVSYISNALKTLARELDAPVVVLAQLNRGSEVREDHRPRMSDLRDSGEIEQDADTVILLHREDYYHRDKSGYVPTNIGQAIVAKQRNGPVGVVDLVWNGCLMTFCNLKRAQGDILL